MKRVSLVRQRSGSWQSCVFSWRLYGKIWFLPFPSSRGCLHFWARGPLSPSPKPTYSRDLVRLSSLISLSPSFLPFFLSHLYGPRSYIGAAHLFQYNFPISRSVSKFKYICYLTSALSFNLNIFVGSEYLVMHITGYLQRAIYCIRVVNPELHHSIN